MVCLPLAVAARFYSIATSERRHFAGSYQSEAVPPSMSGAAVAALFAAIASNRRIKFSVILFEAAGLDSSADRTILFNASMSVLMNEVLVLRSTANVVVGCAP